MCLCPAASVRFGAVAHAPFSRSGFASRLCGSQPPWSLEHQKAQQEKQGQERVSRFAKKRKKPNLITTRRHSLIARAAVVPRLPPGSDPTGNPRAIITSDPCAIIGSHWDLQLCQRSSALALTGASPSFPCFPRPTQKDANPKIPKAANGPPMAADLMPCARAGLDQARQEGSRCPLRPGSHDDGTHASNGGRRSAQGLKEPKIFLFLQTSNTPCPGHSHQSLPPPLV